MGSGHIQVKQEGMSQSHTNTHASSTVTSACNFRKPVTSQKGTGGPQLMVCVPDQSALTERVGI